MSAMMPFLPARMRVFPHSGFKKHDAIPDSASTLHHNGADAIASGSYHNYNSITPGISRLIRVTLKCIINQTTIKKVEIKIRKKINIIV